MSEQTEPIQSGLKCPCCGGSIFVMGDIEGPMPLNFRKENSGWLGGRKPIQARRCEACGNIQLFVEES